MMHWMRQRKSRKHSKMARALLLGLLFLTSLLLEAAFAFSPYSNHELDELEKKFLEEINNSESVLRDPLCNQYMNQLGQKLARESDVPLSPSFFIVKSNEINAFAGPGGHIGINSTLILTSEHESELAAVMAHEIAHVRQHHLYRMLEHQHRMQVPMLASLLAGIALGAINPALGSGAVMATLGGFAQDSINFVRSNEKEADRIGIDMLKRAGFDPRGMIEFFKRMQTQARYYSASVPEILRTHPLDDDRIAEAEHRSSNLKTVTVPDSLNYQLAKERIRAATSSNKKNLLDYYTSRCKSVETQDNPCLYGRALALLNANQDIDAEKILQSLVAEQHENLFYNIALADAQIKLGKPADAITRMQALLENYPEHYALTLTLAKAFTAANRTEDAAYLLLQASRTYPNSLPVCQELAQAQSNNKDKAHAYFTYAQCHLLQGHKKEARRLFRLADTLAKKDKFLHARIAAKLDTLKEEGPDDK